MTDFKLTNSREFTHRTVSALAKSKENKNILAKSLDLLGDKWDTHLPLFLESPSIARILWFKETLDLISSVPGDIWEFGSQWGASLSIISSIMKINEPYNPSRRLVSFSTFSEGFTSTDSSDGKHISAGQYRTSPDWKDTMKNLVLSKNKNLDLRIEEGDAIFTLPSYLERDENRLVSLIHCDMDIYRPTVECLKLAWPRLSVGGVLILDEMNCDAFPGETRAALEVLGRDIRYFRSSYQPYSVYTIKT